ncbi:MAG TPA: histidine kinase [Microlunatus sp.]
MITLVELAFVVTGLGLVVAGVLLGRANRWSAVTMGAAGLFLIIGAVGWSTGRQTSAMVPAGALLAVSIIFFRRRESWRPAGRQPDAVVQMLLVASIAVLMIVALLIGPLGLVAAAWIWAGCVVGWVWWVIDRRAGRDRRSMIWLAGALGGVGIACAIAGFAVPGQLSTALAVLCLWALPAAMIVTGSRTAADPRRVLVQVVVLLVASVAYLAGYAALTALIELTVGPPSTGQATGVALLVALPMPALLRALRSGVAVLVLGRRADAWRTAAGILDRIDRGPRAALSVVATTAHLPFLRLDVDGHAVAVAGASEGPTVDIDLDVDDHVARLVVGLRDGDLSLRSDDRRLLRMIAPLLSEIVRSDLLAAELRSAREQTATARAEERRQLRHELHDGLGPRLSGLVYAVDASRNLLRSDPAAAGKVLVGLRTDIVSAVEEVRRLSYGMRPAVLDDLGLVDALRLLADRLAGDPRRPLDVVITVRGLPQEIPAAAEMATYRIVVDG